MEGERYNRRSWRCSTPPPLSSVPVAEILAACAFSKNFKKIKYSHFLLDYSVKYRNSIYFNKKSNHEELE